MEPQSTPKNSSSKKSWILGLVVLLIVAATAGYYFYNKKQDDKKINQTAAIQAVQNQQAANQEQSKNTLNALTNSGISYVATVSTSTGGKDTSGIMTSDGQGNVSYVYKAEGKEFTLVYTKDAYYLCASGSQCLKYNLSSAPSSTFNPSAYQYDGSKLAELKNSAAYKGQQSCPSPATGTCEVWSVVNGSVTTTIYVNTDTKRIAKASTVSGTTKNDVTYEYKNATVTVPTVFTTIPSTAQ